MYKIFYEFKFSEQWFQTILNSYHSLSDWIPVESLSHSRTSKGTNIIFVQTAMN